MSLDELKAEMNDLYVDDKGDFNYLKIGRPINNEEKATYLYHILCDSPAIIDFLKSCHRANRERIVQYLGNEDHTENVLNVLQTEIESWS